MDAQIDHTTGLFMLRENNKPLNIYCTKMVYDDLTTGNPILKFSNIIVMSTGMKLMLV